MKLYVVGFGPGDEQNMTQAAKNAILHSDIVVGYTTYIDILQSFFPHKNYVATGMREEKDRVGYALLQASQGNTVSLVCSGDSEIYGMAGLTLEMAVSYSDVDVVVVPGVTAAAGGGALLGAPLTHDFCVVSLSDLLTPWETIARRLQGAAMADFVIVLYNPASRSRADYLKKACDILLQYKSGDTVCGYAKNIGRNNEQTAVLSLAELKHVKADMFTTVFVGNSQTKNINGKMVTPRGYQGV